MIKYRLFLFFSAPVLLAYVIWKGFQCRQLRFVVQRFGLGLGNIPEHCLWLHCASVGETNTALPLIRELHARLPELCFVITTNTSTGAKIVSHQKEDYIHHAYLPFDWVFTVRLFLKTLKPIALFIVETELWPNLIAVCKKLSIDTCIVNGRLSVKTTATKGWVRKLHKNTLHNIGTVFSRSEKDEHSFIYMGAATNKVTTLGNIKYSTPDIAKIQNQNITQREYVLVASTHADEEYQIAKCWNSLHRDELLVFAIRHPERGEDVCFKLHSISTKLTLRSITTEIKNDTKIYVLDTVGELMSWFCNAKLVIIGGSFVPIGGHNILEPAHFGKAIIYGPHMENFTDESDLLLAKDAARQVMDYVELESCLAELLDDEQARAELENNVKQAVAPFSHVVADYADALEPLIKVNMIKN